jgi:hypothetical protein
MRINPRRSKRDPFSVLILVVVIGMAITLLYQLHVYYGGDSISFARQSPAQRAFGG